MKYVLIIFLGILSQISFSQQNAQTVVEAISQNNGTSIVKFFNEETDVTVLDEDEIGAKGGSLVSSFFNSNKVSNFQVKHEGTSKLGDVYRIGNMTTNKGVYRVTFFTKNTTAGLVVIQFLIEEF